MTPLVDKSCHKCPARSTTRFVSSFEVSHSKTGLQPPLLQNKSVKNQKTLDTNVKLLSHDQNVLLKAVTGSSSDVDFGDAMYSV
jgi:hypothetical protein